MRIGLDVGTATTRIALAGRGLVLQEATVIADCGALPLGMAVGDNARRVLGRTPPHIQAIQPVRRGVVASPVATRELLTRLFKKALGWKLRGRPVVTATVPSRATLLERQALQAACLAAGSGRVSLIPRPVAAAYGADPELSPGHAVAVLDIGAGLTEIAIVSPEIVLRDWIAVGGDDLDQSIVAHLRQFHQLEIGVDAAEEIKLSIGCADEARSSAEKLIYGREMATGLPLEVKLSGAEIRLAMQRPLAQIATLVRMTLDSTPPALAPDVLERGLILSGGGSLLTGMAEFLERDLGVKVRLAAEPTGCAALGALVCPQLPWSEV